MNSLSPFDSVWLVDFEFSQPSGENPTPACMVAREFQTGNVLRLGPTELAGLTAAPFPVDEKSLFVAYYASAELNCFLALGWKLPVRILDLFAEFRCLTSGLATPCGSGLLGALAYFGLDALDAAEKDEMRQLAIRGGPYTDGEMTALIDYCETDVDALARLLPKMLPTIDMPRALLRGRYMAAAARIETAGIPVDVQTMHRLRENWDDIKGALVAEVDTEYGVYVPANRRTVNPESRLGQAILAEACRLGIDPYGLAEAVHVVWSERKSSTADFFAAKREARRITGLTANRIARWEDGRGRDHTTWPGLDTVSRDLADRLPALGLGGGYETGNDDTDHAVALWELLRDDTDRPPPKHDPSIISEAVDIVLESGVAGMPLSFNTVRFAEYLARENIPWPRLESGAFDLSDDTFRQMTNRYPQLSALRELRHALSQMRLSDLAVGADGRNRVMLSVFRSKTGRNQPSNSKFLFGPSCWLRSLIKPAEGRAVAYVDWCQQEFGIGAALSGDTNMMNAYASGDPYLTFAKQAGAVPPDATKHTHPTERDQFKVCSLAVQFGMGQQSLAFNLGQPEAKARQLLELHRQTYPQFWRWSRGAVDAAMLRGSIRAVFGWTIHTDENTKARTLANFPCQANGAEMLRLACCLLTEAGIRVCAPVHDAVLIEDTVNRIDETVQRAQKLMAEASRVVLGGFKLRTDADVIRWPDRYADKRGQAMWATVMRQLESIEIVAEPTF